MWEELGFKKRRKFTKIDIYVIWIVLFIAVIHEHPQKMWLYLTLLILAMACMIFIEFAKKKEQEESIISYTNVPKEFLKDRNTLSNVHCIAKYFPAQKKIVVMDQPESRLKTELRTFEVSKENVGNVDKVWHDICSVFDEYTFFDTLFSYIDKNSGILRLTFIHRKKEEIVDKTVESTHNYTHKEPEYAPDAVVYSEYGEPLVNIDKLDKKSTKDESTKAESNANNDLVEMNDILHTEDGKIDVNVANAEKLSALPGINIVKAKRIVEYRNINGFFKTKEDFCKVAGLKDHFIEKIKDIITVDRSSKAIVENPRLNNERIVD